MYKFVHIINKKIKILISFILKASGRQRNKGQGGRIRPTSYKAKGVKGDKQQVTLVVKWATACALVLRIRTEADTHEKEMAMGAQMLPAWPEDESWE